MRSSDGLGGVDRSSEDSPASADRRGVPDVSAHSIVRRVAVRLVLLAALAVTAARAAAQDPWFTAPVELEGPLASVVLSAPGARTELRVRLGAGEHRTVRAPFGGGSLTSLEPAAAAQALRVETEPAGASARVVAEAAEGPGRLPRGIAARGRPSAAPQRARPDRARWLLVAGGAVLVLALRRRPVRSAVAGVAAGALVWLLPAAPPGGGAPRGLDGDLASGFWIRARAAEERLAVEPGALGWSVARGAGTPTWTVKGGEWALALPGGELHALLPAAAPARDPAGPPAVPLGRLWLRSPDGRWSAHGAWRPGEPFPPPAREDAPMPPGRLAAGLPQGVGVLVGLPSGEGALDWLRATGWTPPERIESR